MEQFILRSPARECPQALHKSIRREARPLSLQQGGICPQYRFFVLDIKDAAILNSIGNTTK
ncbi:MAG: hypothetical protein A2Z19_05555 [Deltaproteobacteria bacterium RBG_16_54_18]|nr:MAG: hypothetical protein A2Z19_05555 [Deltaproteobacteria bacterium RBG_16_54_18]